MRTLLLSSAAYMIPKVFNLGVASRILLIVVKPLALIISVKLGTSGGQELAQIYLLGILYVSMSGTNAHRKFYTQAFDTEGTFGKLSQNREYTHYIRTLSLQLVTITIAGLIVSYVLFYQSPAIAIIGVLYGLSEKINDEFQRYAQFCNDNESLFLLAGMKLIICLLSALLLAVTSIPIWISFPVLLIVGSILINRPPVIKSTQYLLGLGSANIVALFKQSASKVQADISQIGWVFTSMSLANMDKWLIKFFALDSLATYTLFVQATTVVLVGQTIFLVAPARVRLMKENPDKINALKYGSAFLACIPLVAGGLLTTYYGLTIYWYALFIAGIMTFTVAYSERLYWITKDKVRVRIDLCCLAVIALSITQFFFSYPDHNVYVYLSTLVLVLLIRTVIIVNLVHRNGMH